MKMSEAPFRDSLVGLLTSTASRTEEVSRLLREAPPAPELPAPVLAELLRLGADLHVVARNLADTATPSFTRKVEKLLVEATHPGSGLADLSEATNRGLADAQAALAVLAQSTDVLRARHAQGRVGFDPIWWLIWIKILATVTVVLRQQHADVTAILNAAGASAAEDPGEPAVAGPLPRTQPRGLA
jgi:hypothetical protein